MAILVGAEERHVHRLDRRERPPAEAPHNCEEDRGREEGCQETVERRDRDDPPAHEAGGSSAEVFFLRQKAPDSLPEGQDGGQPLGQTLVADHHDHTDTGEHSDGGDE